MFQTLAPPPPGAVYTLPEATVQQARQQYDEDGYERIVALRDFINEHQQESDWNKLHLVNQFANRKVRFVSDRDHWGQLDYWASPPRIVGDRCRRLRRLQHPEVFYAARHGCAR